MIKRFIIRFLCCLVFISLVCTAYGQTWKDLDTKTMAYYKAGNIDSAIFYAIKELAKARREFREVDSNYYSSLNNLGALYEQKGDNVKAEPLLLQSLAIVKKVLGPEHPTYAASLDNLGYLYFGMRNYAKAETFYIEGLVIHKKILGAKNPGYVPYLNALAGLYFATGNYPKAEPLLLEALSINKASLGIEHHDYAVSLNNLALLYKYMGNYVKAEPLFLEATGIIKRVKGAQHPDYAAALNNLAGLYKEMGNADKAEPLYLEALAIRKKGLGPEHPDYAVSLNNLAEFYQSTGNYTKAEPLLVESLAIIKQAKGEQYPGYALSLNNLAFLYQSMGNYQKAEHLYLEALYIRKQVLGPEHPDYAVSLNNLAALYQFMGDYAKAEPMYLEALAIRKKTLGPQHPDYAASLNNLAELYKSAGDYQKAEPMYVEAMIIHMNSLGAEHPSYAVFLNNLAFLYAEMGNYPKAEPLFLQEKKIVLKHISNNFNFFSEEEKEKYMAKVSPNFEAWHSFFKNYYPAHPSIAAESYDIELATKGMILSSGIQLRQAINGSGDQEAIVLFDHWTRLKNTLAKLYSILVAQRQMSTDSIENLANNDEKELTRLSASFRQGKLLTQTNWKNVQQALKPGEVAIEFTSFQYYDDKRWTDTILYTALVLRKGDLYPAMVSLCRQDQLDSLLNRANNTRAAFISNLYRGVKVSTTNTSTATLQKLYKLVWKPIEVLLRPGNHIYYAPSGLLHQVAFAAIPRQDGALLSDRYRLTQLSSTAMLLQPVPAINTKNLSIAAYGGIQYDASATELASVALKDTQRLVSKPLLANNARSGTSFDYLPGTLKEINSIDSLAKLYHVPVKLYSGTAATEENYKKYSLGPSPRIIHIATHGFFFPDPKKSNRGTTGLSGGEKQQFSLSDNPLNRAGLLFAGGNRAWKGEAPQAGLEDGILTAYEASNVQLSSTQLVVLSACETGLGDIKGSEGVFGLQRAFKAAGATYLLMSLWQVPDLETAEFMRGFYKNLFSGQSIEKAFTSSQSAMKKKYRNDPYKWAAFVLMR